MSATHQSPGLDFEHRLRFESMLADLAARFVGLPSDRVHGEISDALEQLCDFLGIDRATVWEFEPANPNEAHLRHVSQIPGGPPSRRD